MMFVTDKGPHLLQNPFFNKGSAFSREERDRFELAGYLPPYISNMEEQLVRVKENYKREKTPLTKYTYLRALQDRNETLYFAFILKNLESVLPIIYTPTVGEACRQYSHIFGRSRGLCITPQNIHCIDNMFKHIQSENIEIIVATDNEGILGLGDLGIGGMGIPIGKLSLYVAAAGIHPMGCLPITLDVGTDNQEILNDPLYLGLRQERLRGEKYFEFIDLFVEGVKKNCPSAVLQWEDLSRQNAFTILNRYRKTIPSFNDDIQGTGAIILAGTLAALKIKRERLKDQVFVLYGAGAGGIGIGTQILNSLMFEGLSEKEAASRIFAMDPFGLITKERKGLEDYKKPFAKDGEIIFQQTKKDPSTITLEEVIKHTKATVLYGTSGQPRTFTSDIIKAMQKNTERPIIFALSNPTSKAEAVPQDMYNWSEGKAIVATGSPFSKVRYGPKLFRVGQGNNVFVFPGIGLGSIVSKTTEVSDNMITTSAYAVCEQVSQKDMKDGYVYPQIKKLREVSKTVAYYVAKEAIKEKNAPYFSDKDILKRIEEKMWVPRYLPYTDTMP
jgi:malate dehydrogenase (oxaloacetate-decarboxylating)